MAGIYIHIPFCKKACHYCNFHFSTNLRQGSEMIDCILKEIDLRFDYIKESIESIYFGGGTPSILPIYEIDKLLQKIYDQYNVLDSAEITIEANPDDLNIQVLKDMNRIGINRLSIGVQSFHDSDLIFMNRAHDAKMAINCLDWIKKAGFDNYSVDLIYGSPTTSHRQWESNLAVLLKHEVPHISAYALTVEPKTALELMIKKGKCKAVNNDHIAQQFSILQDVLEAAHYEHYEISNFCRDHKYAKHNTNYWKGEKYIGLGPAAHSFDGRHRQWNISHNIKYIQAIQQGKLCCEKESLSPQDTFNEYIMTGLRTQWGIELSKINQLLDKNFEDWYESLNNLLDKGLIQKKGDRLLLDKHAKIISDTVISDLFIV